MTGLKLFNVKGGVREVASRPAARERDLQQLVEANLETMLGVRFLASEYSTGPVHGGRIDTLRPSTCTVRLQVRRDADRAQWYADVRPVPYAVPQRSA